MNIIIILTSQTETDTNFYGLGRGIAQVVSRRLPTAAARIRAGVRSCGICGTGTGFLRALQLPCQFAFHHNHNLSSGTGTIGQTVAAVPSGLISPHEKKIVRPSGLQWRVAPRESGISKKNIASIFRQTFTYFCSFLARITLRPWWWGWSAPRKRRPLSELHSITAQMTTLFIHTAVRTWYTTLHNIISC
jgi:hypothetical protein